MAIVPQQSYETLAGAATVPQQEYTRLFGRLPVPTPLYGTMGKYTAPDNSYLMDLLGKSPQVPPELQGMTQLGFSPEAYQSAHQGTGGSGELLDPNAATWNDSWGWLSPTTNIRQVETGDKGSLNSILGLAALATGGAYMGGAFAPGGQFAGAAAAAPAAETSAGSGLAPVDYSLLGEGAAPSLSTYGTGGLAGTGVPSLSTYGMGGLPEVLAGTGGSALGVLSGAEGLTGSALVGSEVGPFLPDLTSKASSLLPAAKSLLNNGGEVGPFLPGLAGPVLNGLTGGSGTGGYLSNLLSAGNAYNQGQNTSDTFDKAFNLITTPSADQQKYRTQLSTLMSNPGSMESSPVYQAMLDQGMNAVNRTSAAKGMLNSGGRLADLTRMGQDTASKYYFPQAELLSNLSGVRGDSAVRALGADALISGQSADNMLQNQMWSDLLGGYRSGGNQSGGTQSRSLLGDVVNWFGNQSSSNQSSSGLPADAFDWIGGSSNPMNYLL